MLPPARPALRIGRFLRDEAGTATIMALFFVLISAVIGGLAIDFNKAMARRTHLQVTADAVAHAALYTRDRKAPAVAIDRALAIAAVNMPPARHGDALLPQDIEFGIWDAATRTFTPDPGARGAVRVSAHRIAERDNPVRNLLLRMAGFPTFDLSRAAVYVTYQPTCFRAAYFRLVE